MGLDSPALRTAAFAYVRRCADARGGTITRAELEAFTFAGVQVKLIAQMQGINNPKVLDACISVVSSPTGPYEDEAVSDGVWDYAYEGKTPGRTNIRLRRAMELGLPIIFLEKVRDGIYIPYTDVVVVGDRPQDLRFELALGDVSQLGNPADDTPVERAYREVVVEQRLHQPKFRARVLTAYETQCTVCHFRHAELLDAAHILGDRHERGDATVTNGMAMCKIHHAAYDRNFLGVTADYEIRINSDLLAEKDGPMLRYGLQAMHGQQIIVPRRKAEQPDKDRLAERFAQFSAT
ncbi:HNH endonuclease [Demequina sp.]|uniref:HNH endonuclease n=1 Tax=Demequina sp. TaxID=2050685 RepID=UPI003D104D96